MKQRKWIWKRVRPGLYQTRRHDGAVVSTIERGAETSRWWWEAFAEGGFITGCEFSLREAKAAAQRILGPA